jgi:putative transposase
VHRIGNVLDKLPKRLQPKAKAALHGIMKAESREAALLEIDRFEEEYGTKYPKSVETLRRDQDTLEMAQQRWRRLNASELLPLVRAKVPFKDGVRVERDDQTPEEQPVEIAA